MTDAKISETMILSTMILSELLMSLLVMKVINLLIKLNIAIIPNATIVPNTTSEPNAKTSDLKEAIDAIMLRIRSIQGTVDGGGEEESFFNEKVFAAIADLHRSIDSCEARIEGHRMNKLIKEFGKMRIEDDGRMKTPTPDDEMEELINDFERLKIEGDKDEEEVEEMMKDIKALGTTLKNELEAYVKQLDSTTSDSILTSGGTESITDVYPVIEQSNGNKIMSLVMEHANGIKRISTKIH